MSDPIQHPISELGFFVEHTRSWLVEVRESADTFEHARTHPYVLTDADVTRIRQVYTQQIEDLGLFEQTATRWRALPHHTTAHQDDLDALDDQLRQLRQFTTSILALTDTLKDQTIETMMAMSDLELGLAAILTDQHNTNDPKVTPL